MTTVTIRMTCSHQEVKDLKSMIEAKFGDRADVYVTDSPPDPALKSATNILAGNPDKPDKLDKPKVDRDPLAGDDFKKS